ncbi:MAG TPA: RsmE family RNA methyltransferase [Holophaga sp.]|nr:RsmE family RNA methyltransferase [Holophaga sp.]
MSLPRFFLPAADASRAEDLVALDPTQARHANVLRLKPGDALEVVLGSGIWRAELAAGSKDRAQARLVARLEEDCEPPVPIVIWLPVTAQLSLVDDMLPPLVELGATLLQPVVYARSEYEARKALPRVDRWRRLVAAACEQSHRTRIPVLGEPVPFEALLEVDLPQKWVAYERPTSDPNPAFERRAIALTTGPEGGITEGEYEALRRTGWQTVSLGRSILRAVTAPAALLGAVQYELAR